MIKPFVFACRRVGAGAFVAAIALFVFATIAVTATGSRAAPERIDACKAYAVYAEAGSGDSGLAKGMQRVCAAVGSVPLTQACMTYHTRVSDPDFPPDDDLKLKLAVDCENSMPGGTVISATDTSHGGAVSPPIEVSTSGWDTNLACGTGLECWPEPNDPAPVPSGEIDVVTAGDQAAPDDADIAGPPMPAPECGNGLECRPAPDGIASADAAVPDKTAAPPQAAAAANVPAGAKICDTDTGCDDTQQSAAPESPATTSPRIILPDSSMATSVAAAVPEPDVTEVTPLNDSRTDPTISEPQSVLAAEDSVPVVKTNAFVPGTDVPLSPEALYTAAQALLDEAYQQPVETWHEAVAPGVAMLVEAGAAGWAPAYVELGGLVENGIGMQADRDMALGYYMEAGRMGALEGYFRALMLYDAEGSDAPYVETFLMLYRADPEKALESLDVVGRNGPIALQRYLKDQGYYTGALDGVFGTGSRSALAGFVAGGPKPDAVDPVTVSETPARAETPDPPADGLSVELQMALKRVGCYPGPVDGRWGVASANALSAFNRWRGTHFSTQMPSVQALAGVNRAHGPVCGVD